MTRSTIVAFLERPELAERPEYKALLDQDREALAELGLEKVGTALLELFKLVSAGGAEFVRVISDSLCGVSPKGVVGSQVDYELVRENVRRRDGPSGDACADAHRLLIRAKAAGRSDR